MERCYYMCMPPSTPPHVPETHPDHLLPEHAKRKSGSGPIVGIVIILLLLIFGGLYFWGAALNGRESEPLPLIPGDTVNS